MKCLPGPLAVADYSFLDPSLLDYLSEVPVIVMDNFGAGAYPNKGRSNDGRDIVQVPRQANLVSIFQPAEDARPFSQVPTLEGRTGCRVRGSSSSTFPRKPLSVEFWDEKNEDLERSPFGFAAEADWVLNPPNPVYDRSLLHNPVSFGFARLLGALAPESEVVVVFQNTDGGPVTSRDLAGVYIFSEKIERNRLGMDFARLSDDGREGGWLLNIDRMAAIPEGLPVTTTQPNFHAAGTNGRLEIPDDQQNSGGSQFVDDISEFYHSYLNFEHPGGYEILPDQRAVIQQATRAMDAAVWSGDFADHLDLESWARNFAVHNFTKNQDAHVLSTFLYRENPTSKIKMGPVWDFDRAYTWKGGARDTPRWAADRDWYPGLFRDADFRQILQDLWQETRQEGTTNENLEALVDDAAVGLRADQINASGIAFATWQNRVTEMRRWVVERAEYLDQQYEPLPLFSAPGGQFDPPLSLTLTAVDGGTVYFTTDGSDPRAPGGDLAPSAMPDTSPLNLTGRTLVTARTRDGSRWSGPVSGFYYREADLPRLTITEIHYHPADPSPGEISLGFSNDGDFEFLELTNPGTTTIPLDSLVFTRGITFDFSNSLVPELAPGDRVLVVRNQRAFEARYGQGFPIAGEFSGALNNAGDHLVLQDTATGLTLLDFAYADDHPWPLCADGAGYSLTLKNPGSYPDSGDSENWRCSSRPNGNPGTSDARPFSGDPQADLDRDGFSHLLEHFLGTSDSLPEDARELITIGTILTVDAQSYPILTITFQVGADTLTATPQWSPDLQDWFEGPDHLTMTGQIQNGDGTVTRTWRSTRPATSPPQFLRLKVSQN